MESKITLGNLLDLIDYNRESETEKIQICRPNSNWDDYDELPTGSALLLPFQDAVITEMGAVDNGVIRIDIDWDDLNCWLKEDGKQKGEG